MGMEESREGDSERWTERKIEKGERMREGGREREEYRESGEETTQRERDGERGEERER